MTDTLKTYLTRIHIGAEQSFKNLSIFPLISDYSIPFDYLTIEDALSKDMVEVVEINPDGSASKHKVINKSDQMVLIFNGEKMAGTNQYRNVGTTIMLPAKKTVVIPINLLKKNRSPYCSNRFHSKRHVTGSRNYLEHFASVDYQIGALFTINGKVAGMDCFGRPEVLERTLMNVIEGYAQDAADKFSPKMKLKSSKSEAINFLQTAKKSLGEIQPAARLKIGCRLNSKQYSGFALAHEDQVLHLSLVAKN